MPERNVRLSIAGLIGAAATALALPACAAPEADLWPRWQAHAPDSDKTIDHSPWERFLELYLAERESGANRVAYADVRPRDERRLDAYIERLAEVQISEYTRDRQFAYWVNLYNALTVQVVLDHYPVETIRDIDISPGLFADGPWDKELVTVEGAALSLNDIEHRILRPIWQDPRIHYAVNCASIGCPDLRPEPYRAVDLESQLNAAARGYVNSARGAEVTGDGLVVSKIYTWYQADFGGTDAGVIRHLRRYADPELKAELEGVREIADSRYDWSLNGLEAAGS